MENAPQDLGMSQLAKAFVAAYAEIDNVVKNANNPHFGSNYADLGAVLDTIRPIFAKHKLALLQAPGKIDGDKLSLIGLLMHESGQSVSFEMQVPMGKATAQAAGSAITYMRRYQAAAVAGIAQVDDDGNAASDSKARKSAAPDTNYAATAEALIARIEATESLADLETLKPEVADLGDQKVADVYVARKKALKGKK
jgi:hypothetical protein